MSNSNITEAANRGEVTALLLRSGYRIYRPEADVDGEDLVLRTPKRRLIAVQLKGRPAVDYTRYGARKLWMLFPSHKFKFGAVRGWYLVPHDHFYEWVERRHGHTQKWRKKWDYPHFGKDLEKFLAPYEIRNSQ